MSVSLSLDDLGQRICIIGPSNSGKSTLAKAIGRKKSLPLVHLDQLHHQPSSQWVPRKAEDFLRLHEEAVGEENWVMEGNYAKCIHPRLARATGLILLDISRSTALCRYIIRCYSSKPRIGGIGIQTESISWVMMKHILYHSPRNHLRYRALFEQSTLPKLMLSTPRAVNTYYKEWKLNE
ncbi:AAA family ATPase [Rosenbergiella nectarea]|uniref:AAA family ATPase n=1 Tax=Rosenbergiella nectarea TaxID=988801 RepID=UPI001F4E817D|nr:AAA family ATPase [Rosenbergiella nectarea]